MSAENISRPLQIATLGIGNGRSHFAQSLRTHADSMGIQSETLDLLDNLSDKEILALRAGYHFLSKCPPIVYRFIRSAYGKSGPKSIDSSGISNKFDDGTVAISVTPVTAQMLTESGVPFVQMVGDRIVQPGDTSHGAKLIAVPYLDIDGIKRINGDCRVQEIGGIVQPASLARIDTDDRRREFEWDANPHVLFSVNGAGDMGTVENVILQLWPLVEEQKIRLSIFAGNDTRVSAKVRKISVNYDIPCRESSNPNKALENALNLYFANEKADAIMLRMHLLDTVHIMIPASPMEMMNGPWVVLFDESTARNIGEQANARYAVKHGWALSAGHNFQGLELKVRQLLGHDTNYQTLGMEMYDSAVRYNDPWAGVRLIEAWREESGQQ